MSAVTAAVVAWSVREHCAALIFLSIGVSPWRYLNRTTNERAMTALHDRRHDKYRGAIATDELPISRERSENLTHKMR
jgi:hypothetical protein